MVQAGDPHPRFVVADSAARRGVMACLAAILAVAGAGLAGAAAPGIALPAIGIVAVLAALLTWRAEPRSASADAAPEATARPAPALVRAMIESMPDPLLLLDQRGRVVEANGPARRLFGAGIAGKPLASVLRNPTLLDAVEALIGGETVEEVAFTLPVPIERHLQAALSRLRFAGEDGAPAGPTMLVLFRDITAMRRMEDMRVDFVANVSHELRTPLSVLAGFIETLRGPARDDAEARERFLDIMEDQARRMARLIDDLLSLSRIEMDEHVPPSGRVDLAELAAGVAAALQPLARASDVTLAVTLPPGLPPVVGDRDQLFQVLQNLVDNAIKYGGAGGSVTIEAGRPALPGHVAVTVRDRGEGIARAHLPRLTERFYRVDTARSRERCGTGLGLAIVKHVVNRHNGRLAIDSAPGQGSAFTVSLPAA